MKRPVRKVESVADYKQWKRDENSRVCLYHIGHLQQDRVAGGGEKAPLRYNRKIHTLAKKILDDAEYEDILVCQKRVMFNTFEYYAVKPR